MPNFWGLNYDKWLHLFAGYIITITLLVFNITLLFTLLTAVSIAFAKEIYDDYVGRYFDWHDFIWTILGSLLAVGVYFFTKV